MSSAQRCVFCQIVRGERQAHAVHEDATALAFLDHRPLFPGHVLVVPKEHCATLGDLPVARLSPFFATVQMLATAVETAMEAEGTFVALNNRVSQSVPHLHVHVVPRRRRDGLRGFFWPRQPYGGPEHISSVQASVRRSVAELLSDGSSAIRRRPEPWSS